MSFFPFKKKTTPQPNEAALPMVLRKTKEGLLARISRIAAGKSNIDSAVLDNLEEVLIAADIGVETTLTIVERIEKRASRDKSLTADRLSSVLCEEISALLCQTHSAGGKDTGNQYAKPYVIMVAGVNGAGKTTTIGKLAAQYAAAGKKVYIGAADTFRAAAIEQLENWARRSNAVLVKQQTGADPAAVAYDTVNAARAHSADIVLIDTAGRLHNKTNLMNELAKIRSVIGKAEESAPHETLLVIDGSAGQNAYRQAQEFAKTAKVTGLVITKLDGTAKGGAVIGICAQFGIPVKYIGVGERADDLQQFDSRRFVEAIFN